MVNMKYKSTRGGSSGLSFEEVLLSGYASDGGLFVPENVPVISADKLKSWSKLSYKEILIKLIPFFVSEDEVPEIDQADIINRAFSRFDSPNIIELASLSKGLNILELFHGPTLAFKDLGLSCVGQFYEYFLQKRKKHATIIVGTSGDTGSAAIESVRGLKWVDIIVLLPKGRVTKVQELQMTTVIEDNVQVFRVDGTSDELDLPIKKCFLDAAFVKKHLLCGLNSINWARIMFQMAHYFYAYFLLSPDCDREVEIAIPTGACGNCTGGFLAQEMGLPVKLVCCVNSNDIVARTIKEGDFSMAKELKSTLASAMDIQVPYNVERLLYFASGRNSATIKQMMDRFDREGKINIAPDILHRLQEKMSSFAVDDETIVKTIQECWASDQFILCPHTATAAAYHYHQVKSDKDAKRPRICIATASHAKFGEVIQSAGLTPQLPDSVKELDDKPTKYKDMNKGEDWEKVIRDTIEEITAKKATF